MPAFLEDGGLLTQRSPSPFLDQSGFIGTQEAEQRKGVVSHVTCLGRHLLGSGLSGDCYLKPSLRSDLSVIIQKITVQNCNLVIGVQMPEG